MDTGKTRTVGDQLARRGSKDYAVCAAVARLCVQYDEGWLQSAQSPTHSQAIEFYDANAVPIQDFVSHCRIHNYSAVTPSSLAAGAFLIHRRSGDYDAVMQFVNSIKEGIDLQPGDPVLAFRNRIQQARNMKERIDNSTSLLMLLRAWNYWRTGQKMEKFPIRKSGKLVTITEIEK
jgi:hypothetical protein